MVPTLLGLLFLVAALFLAFRGDAMSMLEMVLVSSLFGGSAALLLPALGGASVPPLQVLIGIAIIRLVLLSNRRVGALRSSVSANILFALFCVYGVICAFLAPRYFAGAIEVVPLRGSYVERTLFDTTPLVFTSQNITVSTYLISDLFAAMIGFLAVLSQDGPFRFARVAIFVTWAHIFFGVTASLLKGTPYDLFIDFLRNANYSQVDQSIEGFSRINGIFPEPSSYTAYGFAWLVLMFEFWLRDILPRRTGPAAVAMTFVLIATTSSTAYVSIAAYLIIVIARLVLFPQALEARKAFVGVVAALVIITGTAMALFWLPNVSAKLGTMFWGLTIGKQQSESGIQRAFWAHIGLEAFKVSRAVGIGPGSFRSSSLATAMLGSVGIVGTALFLAHLVRALRPLKMSTYYGASYSSVYGEATLVGAAAAWGAVGALIPLVFISASCDPSAVFAIFTGVALSLRSAGRTARYKSLESYRIPSIH